MVSKLWSLIPLKGKYSFIQKTLSLPLRSLHELYSKRPAYMNAFKLISWSSIILMNQFLPHLLWLFQLWRWNIFILLPLWIWMDRQQMPIKHWRELSLINKPARCLNKKRMSGEFSNLRVWPLVSLSPLVFLRDKSIELPWSCKHCTNTWLKEIANA